MLVRTRCVKIIHSFEEEMISVGIVSHYFPMCNLLFVFQQAENFASERTFVPFQI